MAIGDNRASAIKLRLGKILTYWGQSFTYKEVSPSGSTTTVTGKLSVLSNTEKFTEFTSTETTGWASPAYALVIAGDFLPFSAEPVASPTGTAQQRVTIRGTDYRVAKCSKAPRKLGTTQISTKLFLFTT
jgi:hypothetical protein